MEQGSSRSRRVREGLDHPVIDSDAHIMEFVPALFDFVREREGEAFVARFLEVSGLPLGPIGTRNTRERLEWESLSPSERRAAWAIRPPWSMPHEKMLDWMTVQLPRLLYERLDERLYNEFIQGHYAEFRDRLTVPALIPMHTPEEAIAELERAAALGAKVAMIPSYVFRPIEKLAAKYPEMEVDDRPLWMDTYGLDSQHDYDPFWARAVELGMPLGCHSGGQGFPDRRSTSNYMFNHIGHFAQAGEAICKSLFFGGVSRRFPDLRIAFLEGGASFGVRVYADLFGRWEKRGAAALRRYRPEWLDAEQAVELLGRYGGELGEGRKDQMRGLIEARREAFRIDLERDDEFALAGIESPVDIRDRFIPNFFFGCEADDPTNVLAFRPELWPLRVSPKAIFSSDIGHWDVEEMNEVLAEAWELVEDGLLDEDDFRRFTFGEVLAEAWELVEDGLLDEDDFRRFTFGNAVDLMAGANPDFFEGTAIEEDVAKLQASRSTSP
jgi:hypothetical protein